MARHATHLRFSCDCRPSHKQCLQTQLSRKAQRNMHASTFAKCFCVFVASGIDAPQNLTNGWPAQGSPLGPVSETKGKANVRLRKKIIKTWFGLSWGGFRKVTVCPRSLLLHRRAIQHATMHAGVRRPQRRPLVRNGCKVAACRFAASLPRVLLHPW
jgi:hypothetical protein